MPALHLVPRIILGAVLLHTAAATSPKSALAAAKCLALGKTCSADYASSSDYCKAATPPSGQSAACYDLACKYCSTLTRRAAVPCTSAILQRACGMSKGTDKMPMMSTSPTPSPSPMKKMMKPRRSRYHAAKCIELGTRCTNYFVFYASPCVPGVAAEAQSTECEKLACLWCALPGRAESAPCTDPVLQKLCGFGGDGDGDGDDMSPPMPSFAPMEPQMPVAAPEPAPIMPSPEPSMGTDNSPTPRFPDVPERAAPRRAAGACTHTGGEEVVVSLGRVVPAAGWTTVRRDGFRGLVYRADLDEGIVEPAQGEMCFPLRVARGGDYYLTAVSYAPHRTDNNDMWVKVRNKGLRLWKNGESTFFLRGADRYLKAYQNNSSKFGMSVKMWTKDHDPHRFVVRDVKANETVTVCIAGRSFKYEVYRIVMKRCMGDICTGGRLRKDDVWKMPISNCV